MRLVLATNLILQVVLPKDFVSVILEMILYTVLLSSKILGKTRGGCLHIGTLLSGVVLESDSYGKH
jgi:hypothetical protein